MNPPATCPVWADRRGTAPTRPPGAIRTAAPPEEGTTSRRASRLARASWLRRTKGSTKGPQPGSRWLGAKTVGSIVTGGPLSTALKSFFCSGALAGPHLRLPCLRLPAAA